MAAIGLGKLGTTEMSRRSSSTDAVRLGFVAERERDRERRETGERVRDKGERGSSALWGASSPRVGNGSEARAPEMAHGRYRRKTTGTFCSQPPEVFFFLYSGPFLFLFYVFYFIYCSKLII